ncbi:MAG: carboxypeptidase-like regulatory domain-containing protein [Bacteroidota bacterium]|nr:carboxypeptidase-like regulatory domain-containing protein [Bacteroidota bacterium]
MPAFYAYFRKWFLGGFLIFLAVQASGQEVTIRGTVFNMYKTHPLESVSVISSSGQGTVTDENGNYSIRVNENDSLSFSYLGRNTQMFAVKEMNHITGFDIALHVNPTILNEVRVTPRNYHMDSLQNRIDYQKSFDYKKPGLKLTSPGSGLGVGLDLDALISMMKFKEIRRAKAFQSRLIEDEEDKFVDHRFNRYTVKKITHLDGDQLDSFMTAFRPSYHFAKTASDYDFLDYIKLAFEEFRLGLEKPKGKEN